MKWLTGKKTYIGAAGLAVTGVVSFWFGAIDATTLSSMLSGSLIAVGLGHKLDRYLSGGVALLGQERDRVKGTQAK
jgi:hypothetical protein